MLQELGTDHRMETTTSHNRIIVYHVGSRDGYTAATVFEKKKILERFYTDYWLKSGSKKLLRSVGGRRGTSFLDNKVESYSLFRILFTEIRKRFFKSRFSIWCYSGSRFGNFVNDKLKYSLAPDKKFILWGYTGANLEVLENFKDDERFLSIHNQIDPGLAFYENDLDWNNDGKSEYLERIKSEWELADIILVNSEFSRLSMARHGISLEKMIVVPLIYNVKIEAGQRRFDNRLKIAFVGNINSVKGFETFVNVAKSLR